MRVSEAFSHRVFLRSLELVQRQLDDALARMSSGKRVRYASDDPEAAKELAKLADETQLLTMRRNGLSQARPWLQMTELAVSELGNALTQALTYAIQGASTTMQQEEYDALAEQIVGIQTQIRGLTELRIAGRYIFSGTQTDQPPYDDAGVYVGNDGTIAIPLDEGTTQINLPGDDVFGDVNGGPLKLLNDLEAALRAGDDDAIRALLDPLRDAIGANASTLARVGRFRRALEDADLRLDSRQFEVQSRANDLGAADMAEAIADVSRLQISQQAALAAGARLYGPTFFDYIG